MASTLENSVTVPGRMFFGSHLPVKLGAVAALCKYESLRLGRSRASRILCPANG
jgi:hypothetical protein